MIASRERWLELSRKLCGASGAGADAAYAAIDALYRVPPRPYHNLAHVSACLEVLDEVADSAVSPTSAEYALWLHDAICEPARGDNEQRSAAAARVLGVGLGFPANVLRDVEVMILATRHAGPADTPDGALVADIDLTILAADGDRYREYARAIRAEYSAHDDAAYSAGRIRFLNALLARARIFQTAIFRDRLETAARRNLADEIRELSK